MDYIQVFIGIAGWSLGTLVIRYFLDRSAILSERNYVYKKEELLRYRAIVESLIEKLMLLENHRDLMLSYLQLHYEASMKEGTKFIDLNNTLDTSSFQSNQERIITMIFLYFHEFHEDWNECVNTMSAILTIISTIELKSKEWAQINWKEDIEDFNKLNQKLGDRPLELCEKIKDVIRQKEKEVENQRGRFYLL